MAKKSTSMMVKALDWAYETALDGLPRQPTAIELGNEYLDEFKNIDDAIESLINWQTLKCGTSGFLTGLGGFMTLPVAIPADIAVTYYVNVRMVAAIAHMKGYDLKSDKTRTLVFLTLVGDAAGEVLSKAGVKLGTRLAEAAIAKVPGQVLMKINQAIGFRLATKAGQKGVINLLKLAPVFGGMAGAAVNVISCRTIGNTATSMLKSA